MTVYDKERADQTLGACAAVAHACRPRLFDSLAHHANWPSPDRRADVAFILATRIEQRTDLGRSQPWWDAFGFDLSVALAVVTDLDEAAAGFVLGAALQAHLTGKADLAPDHVLRLAERAACWVAGTHHSIAQLRYDEGTTLRNGARP